MSANKVIIMGNLGRDIEIKKTASDLAVINFSIATQEHVNKEKKTEWHRIVAFGKTAETIAKFFSKGDMIYIEGKLSYGSYEKDGITRYTTDVIAYTFSFCGGGRPPSSKGYGDGGDNYETEIDSEEVPF